MTATLGSVCRFLNGGTPSKAVAEYFEGEIPWISSADISGPVAGFVARSFITEDAIKNSAVNKVSAGTVLLVTRTGVGKVAIAGTELCFSQDITALIPDPAKLDTSYLVHFLRTNKDYFLGLSRGATIKGITRNVVSDLSIPLPPLAEQRRIAAILDRTDALRVKRREALAQLDSLTQSIFMEMFGDPVKNSKGWPESITLGDVADLVSGITKGRKVNGAPVRTVPYLAVANVQDKALSLAAVKEIEATEDEIKRYRLKRNDLLLTEGGDPDKLGRGTLWREELPECIHQNHIFRVRLKDERVSPLFLNWLVGSQRGKKYFLRSAKQTTGIASINMSQLRSFPLLLPPIELQRSFELQINKVENQRRIVASALDELDTLFASLQHRAFRGEL